MKQLILLKSLFTLLICLIPFGLKAQNLLDEPESVVYDSVHNRYLVSNYGDGAIVQVDSNGVQSYFNNDLSPYFTMVGLHIKDDYLYAAGGPNAEIKVLDLGTGGIVASIYVPGSVFLNDITTDTSGNLYVTDWEGHRIYKIRLNDHNVSLFVQSGLSQPNGVLFDAPNNRLLAISQSGYRNPIVAVNLQDSTLSEVVQMNTNSCDGLTVDDEGNKYISTWAGDAIFRYDPDFEHSKEYVLSGFTDPADIYFNQKRSEIAVPNMTINRLDIIPLDVGEFTRLYDICPVREGGRTRGVSWADYDNDDLPDLFLANSLLPAGDVNGLYRNTGTSDFDKSTTGDIASDVGLSSSSTWGDYDNDGDLDVFVANESDQPNRLYENDGTGVLMAVTDGELVTETNGSLAASWVDYDNDGNLDLFVANVGANSLFRNYGTTFIKIMDNAIVNQADDSYGAAWGDYNNDGYQDLFIALSDNLNNQLFANNGDGSFTKIVDGGIVNDGGESRGGSWGDYDNDGDLDLFVPNISVSSDGNNFLYENIGDGIFALVTTGDIVNDGGYSLGSSWGDYDNDGDLDLFVANRSWGITPGKDFLYRNNGDGTFDKVVNCEIVEEVENSCGVVWADYDRDGDLDLFVARESDGDLIDNGFYRNNGNDNNWISITCIGAASNASAIGARVSIKANIWGSPVWQMREISAQTGFGSQNPLDVHFGLGDATIIDSMVVLWPTGISQEFVNLEVNQFMSVTDYVAGDANGDAMINVADAVYLINHIFKGGAAPIPNEAGDANCDSQVNVGDAVYLINHVFNGGPGPCSS